MTEEMPKEAIASLVDAVGINRVVCVDDAFALSRAAFVELLAVFSPEERVELLGHSLAQMEQDGIWREKAREEWDTRSDAERATLLDNAYAMEIEVEPIQHGIVEILAEAPNLVCQGWSLQEWKEKRAGVIADLASNPTLILFDQDFQHEDAGGATGEKLIAEFQDELREGAPDDAQAYYGLLTNTVSTSEEHASRNQILERTKIDAARLVVISKQNLQGESLRFVERLRTTLLAPIFAQLVEAVAENVSLVQEEALKEAQEIPPEDLEHMIVRSSEREGVWAPDTLLRVLEVLQRGPVREALRTNRQVRERTEQLRALAEVGPERGTEKKHVGDAPMAVYVSHQEIYEPADHINGLHLPVELGDVFKKGKEKLYVVIAQPCTLMVRENGKRAPEQSHVLLAEISGGSAGEPREVAMFELPYFDPETGERRFVKLGRPAVVRTLVLDACVLNADGKALIDLKADIPDTLLPHWRDRRETLHRKSENVLAKVAKLPPDIRKELQKGVAGSFEADPFTLKRVSSQNKEIEWDCTRILRVADPYARALLTRFSQYFARDAYLHDMARQ